MIAWSIEAAKDSNLFDHVIVSTDSEEIADIAKAYGAEIPFLRPSELSDDLTVTRPVINHAINAVKELYGEPKYACCIYATAPFIKSKDLVTALNEMILANAQFAFSVTSYAYPIQRALRKHENGRIEMFESKYRLTRSQDLEPAYHDAGQFYWGNAKAFLDNLPTFSEHSLPIVLPRYRVQDIDDIEDWIQAELKFKAMISQDSI